MVGGKHVFCQPIMQRLEPPAGAADPSDERRTREIDAVAGKDLRLPIKRRVIAVFADQHLRQQRWRRQATGDHPLGSWRLYHSLTAPAGIFGTRCTDHAQLRRNPVQHLAHAFPNHMQRTAAAGADHVVDIEPHIVTWQMIGQRLAMRAPFGWLVLDPRTALMGAGEIAVEVFKPEGELVGIEMLGTTAKLRALQLLDNGFQALDFAVAMLDRGGDIAHQAMQKRRICREIVEIELHVRFYSNQLIRRICFSTFHTDFCDLPGKRRLPHTLGRAPVDAFDQHCKLCRCQRDRAVMACHHRPDKAALVDPLGEQAKTIAISEQDLQHRCLLAAEGKQMTRERVLSSASPAPAWRARPCPCACRYSRVPGAL
jgi:hypothetical protein